MEKPHFSASELLFDCFLSRRRTYCYGATQEASLFMDRHPGVFDALVDRKFPPGERWNGLPCAELDDIDSDSIVINCVTAANTWGVDQTLQQRTPYVLQLFDLLALLSDNPQFDIEGLSPIIRDWKRFPSVFLQNIEFFEALSSRFADDTSTGVYRDYLDARITGSILTLGRDKAFCDPATMYFQPFLPPLDAFVFLDVGAFDGQNSVAFLNRTQQTRSICVEPDPANVRAIESNLTGLEQRVAVEQVLLGDSAGEFEIEPDGSSTAKIQTATQSSIRVRQCTLDALSMTHMPWVPRRSF